MYASIQSVWYLCDSCSINLFTTSVLCASLTCSLHFCVANTSIRLFLSRTLSVSLSVYIQKYQATHMYNSYNAMSLCTHTQSLSLSVFMYNFFLATCWLAQLPHFLCSWVYNTIIRLYYCKRNAMRSPPLFIVFVVCVCCCSYLFELELCTHARTLCTFSYILFSILRLLCILYSSIS